MATGMEPERKERCECTVNVTVRVGVETQDPTLSPVKNNERILVLSRDIRMT